MELIPGDQMSRDMLCQVLAQMLKKVFDGKTGEEEKPQVKEFRPKEQQDNRLKKAA